MMIATLTQAQVDSLRPSLDVIATQLARRGNAGRRVPEDKRPPASYREGALGWTVPYALYGQRSGAIVVVIERAAWDRLNPASRALFEDLDVVGYPPGFNEGPLAP